MTKKKNMKCDCYAVFFSCNRQAQNPQIYIDKLLVTMATDDGRERLRSNRHRITKEQYRVKTMQFYLSFSIHSLVDCLYEIEKYEYSTCFPSSIEMFFNEQSKCPMICLLRSRPLSMTVNLTVCSCSSL